MKHLDFTRNNPN